MQRHERLTKLFEVILEEESVTVDELVARLGVSVATVRRDLDHLADQQLITRTHGGAVAFPHSSDIPIRYGPGAKLSQEKRRIAASAADQVRPGDIIGLNGGTTTTELARELAVREELRAEAPGEQVVIVTNAVNIATELAVRPHLRVVLTGGVVRSMSFELVGPFASPVIDSVSIGTLFLGATRSPPRGPSPPTTARPRSTADSPPRPAGSSSSPTARSLGPALSRGSAPCPKSIRSSPTTARTRRLSPPSAKRAPKSSSSSSETHPTILTPCPSYPGE